MPRRRHLAHQPMQANTVRCDRWIALVRDDLAIDERKTAQRRHGLVETIASKL
jgi:hypothetical protein